MANLLSTIKDILQQKQHLPFSVYASMKEQRLLNVPTVKPLLVVVLNGVKKLGKNSELTCQAGSFIFLSGSPSIDMRNIPKDNEYFALLIEFDYQDFNGLSVGMLSKKPHYCIGSTSLELEECLQQFVESALWAPEAIWSLRKREVIELLCHMGYSEIVSMVEHPNIGHRLHDMFYEQRHTPITITEICDRLAMSESTLRRKLSLEGTSLQEIKDQARLGLGLHLLQTTQKTVGLIAETCGYQSQSRFTDRFKGRFGLTPSELRKTRMEG